MNSVVSDATAILADKGYDRATLRHDLQERGAAPEIPTKSNRKVQPGAHTPASLSANHQRPVSAAAFDAKGGE